MPAMRFASAHCMLASRLLEMAAREFHEHGCNDMDPQVFEGIPVGQRSVLLAGFNAWHRSTFDASVHFEPLDLDRVGDDQWMSYMAAVLAGGAQ